jgi:hypothetical protein
MVLHCITQLAFKGIVMSLLPFICHPSLFHILRPPWTWICIPIRCLIHPSSIALGGVVALHSSTQDVIILPADKPPYLPPRTANRHEEETRTRSRSAGQTTTTSQLQEAPTLRKGRIPVWCSNLVKPTMQGRLRNGEYPMELMKLQRRESTETNREERHR